jgi:hypothetical protein
VDGLAGEGEPEREQHAGHQLTAQVDGDLAEVDLSFLCGVREYAASSPAAWLSSLATLARSFA